MPFPIHAQEQTLYQCYASQGLKWGSVSERAIKAAQIGIFSYRGTAEQNKAMVMAICGNNLGYGVVTDYSKNLSASMTATQTFVPVTSLTLKDGTDLTTASLGSKVFLVIEPGATKEEIVMCTTVGTLQFTDCVRGLAFSGETTTGVEANAKTHSAGSPVVISNVHYVYNQYVDKNTDQTLSGRIYASSTTLTPLTNAEYVTSYYANTLVAGGFSNLNIDTDRGLSATGGAPEKVGINLTDNQGNLSFDSSGALSAYSTSTANEPINAYAAVVASSTSGGVVMVNTDTQNPYNVFKFVGFNASAGSASGTTISIATPGSTLCGFSGTRTLIPGAYYYLNGTTGKIATTSTSQNADGTIFVARVGFAVTASCLNVLQPHYSFSGRIVQTAGTVAHTMYPVITGFYPASFQVVAAPQFSYGSTSYSGIHQSISIGTPQAGGMNLLTMNSNATGTHWQTEMAVSSDMMAWEISTSTKATGSPNLVTEGQVTSVGANGFSFETFYVPDQNIYIGYTVKSE